MRAVFYWKENEKEESLLSKTLEENLKRYAVGEKVRNLRQAKEMGLVELGRHTGLSAALLSKIERGKVVPTLPTLMRIALVFSVGLEHFFTNERRPMAVVRAAERQRFPEKPDARNVSYHFECLDFHATERKLNAYFAEFHPLGPDNVKMHRHSGIEFIYVIGGRLGLYIRGEEHLLSAGDSIYFDSTLPHGYRRAGKTRCTALVVTVP